MANMSHCMFTNTLADLRDCYEKMAEIDSGDRKLGPEEEKSRQRLIKLCVQIASDYGEE